MNLKDYIRSIPDYPKKGILFRDITTLVKNEIDLAKSLLQPHDTGHLHDYISRLNDRLEEIEK